MAIMTKADIRYFDEARKEAEESDFSKFHLGCVVVYKHHIIGRGKNSTKTSPTQKSYNKYRNLRPDIGRPFTPDSIHAEIDALRSIKYTVRKDIEDSSDWNRVKIYVYRIANNKHMEYNLAKPCKACMKAIRDTGIRDVYYTDSDGLNYLKLHD